MNSRVGTEAVGLLCLSCASEPSALLYAKCRDPATTFGKPLMAASQSKMLKRQCLDRKENTACYNVNQCYTVFILRMLYNVQAGVLATWSWHLTESVQVMTRWPVSVLLQALQDPLLVEYQEWGARTTFCRLHFRLQAWSGKIAQCRSQFWLLASLRWSRLNSN